MLDRGNLIAVAFAAGTALAAIGPASAGDTNGNLMVRILATGVLPDTDAEPIAVGGTPAVFPRTTMKCRIS